MEAREPKGDSDRPANTSVSPFASNLSGGVRDYCNSQAFKSDWLFEIRLEHEHEENFLVKQPDGTAMYVLDGDWEDPQST
jgi:hypothetical protein